MSNVTATASAVVAADTKKVWEAMTNPEKIKEYMFGTTATSDWKVGSPISFKGQWEGKTYEDKGVILRFDPGEVMEYSLLNSGSEDKPENYIKVSCRLEPAGEDTKVTFSQEVLGDEGERVHAEENWAMTLKSLKDYLER